MQRIVSGCFILIFILLSSARIGFGEADEQSAPVPDSVYMEKEDEPAETDEGGLLDFLPFFGNNSKRVPMEKLEPSPQPRESRPVLGDKKLEELQATVNEWILTSDATEPKIRQDEVAKYYRDYIVFGRDYRIEVLRGKTQENPFLAHAYVDGDYFRTKSHYDIEEAQDDFDFNYEKLSFRIIFERVERWEYSDNSSEEPFVFKERWEFRKLQSRPKNNNTGQSRNAQESVDLPKPSPDD